MFSFLTKSDIADNDLRKKRQALTVQVKQIVKEVYQMSTGTTNIYVPVIADYWQQYCLGCFFRSIPLIENGMSIIVWEFTADVSWDVHVHETQETLIIIRGECKIWDENDKLLHFLSNKNICATIPATIAPSNLTI